MLEPLTRKRIRLLGRSAHPAQGDTLYTLLTNCGNLVISDTGKTSCAIYKSDKYPRACESLKEGSYSCGLIQLTRIFRNEDTLASDETSSADS